MVGKPDWMRKIEEEQAAKLIASDRADELAASKKAILSSRATDIWKAIKEKITAVHEIELRGVRFSADDGGNTITVYAIPDEQPKEVLHIAFDRQHYKFAQLDKIGRVALSLYLGVSGGKLALLDEQGNEISCDVQGIADEVSQRLLEPLLRQYAGI